MFILNIFSKFSGVVLKIVPLSVKAAELIKVFIVPNFLSVSDTIFLQSSKLSKFALTLKPIIANPDIGIQMKII